MNKQHILANLINTNTLRVGSRVDAQFHKSASADKRNSEDRDKRSQNGQFGSVQGTVASIKEVSTGLQVFVAKDEGGYGSLTTNQIMRKLVVNGTEVML